MQVFNSPECCANIIFRHMATSDIGQLAITCRLSKARLESTIDGLQTVLPSLMFIYITAFLHHRQVVRLSSTNRPMSINLRDLLLPGGDEWTANLRLTTGAMVNPRPPILLRPESLPDRFIDLTPSGPRQLTKNRVMQKWRPLLEFHPDFHPFGLSGPLCQWSRIRGILDAVHQQHRLYDLLRSPVFLPGPQLAYREWEAELLLRLVSYHQLLSEMYTANQELLTLTRRQAQETLESASDRTTSRFTTNLEATEASRPSRCHIM
jgi:hypothetical protein